MNISYRLVIITAVFITSLITANIVIVKVISLGHFILPACIFIFPLSYTFGDALTEGYGCRMVRTLLIAR